MLNTAPDMLNINELKLPKSIEVRTTLIISTKTASLVPMVNITIIIAIFASPSLTPGTGMGIGTRDSI